MALQQLEVGRNIEGYPGLTLMTVHSSYLRGRGNISVYAPEHSGHVPLPIVVLLHGVYGNHWVWMHLGRAHQVYQRLRNTNDIGDCILVMPEDGSYYAGSAYLPLLHGPDAERWIMHDVLEAVYRCIDGADPSSPLFLTGLSMGGYGALRLGAKYAADGRFRLQGIAAHSSITRLEDLSHFVSEPLSVYQCADQAESDLLHWFKCHCASLPPLRIDCGESDLLLGGNQRFVAELSELGIDIPLEVYPGGHEWPYWERHLEKTLRFFDALLMRSP